MKKIIGFILAIVLVVGGYFGYSFYKKYYGNNVLKEGVFYIPKEAHFEQILDSVAPYLKDKESFKKVALSKNMNRFFHTGRYKITEGMDNTALVNMIKAGNQSPDNFRIIAFDNVYQMMGRVAKKTEVDSLAFIKEFNQIAQAKGLSEAEDLKKYFFIDTYQFFWTVSPKEFFGVFEKQYNDFWNAERLEKEKKLGLDRNQIYALASIVYKESGGRINEQKTIAGLYLNRYRKGMKLQSDPTVIYAINQSSGFNKVIKRVYYKDLKTPSPYNTYANVGIPPGPICVTDKNSVDAVLNAENHDYIYMCADLQKIGFHKFTSSDVEHAKNAKAYQDWLNEKQIK
ncbi:endolytic transglycosylase MltG [Riemerella anatipestifer]|nr:endolytic transglycosylase MltG [Riemerella anatipestifer]